MRARPGIVIGLLVSAVLSMAPAWALDEQKLEEKVTDLTARIDRLDRTVATLSPKPALEPEEMKLLIWAFWVLGLAWIVRSIWEIQSTACTQKTKAKHEGAAATLKALGQDGAKDTKLAESVKELTNRTVDFRLHVDEDLTRIKTALEAVLERLPS